MDEVVAFLLSGPPTSAALVDGLGPRLAGVLPVDRVWIGTVALHPLVAASSSRWTAEEGLVSGSSAAGRGDRGDLPREDDGAARHRRSDPPRPRGADPRRRLVLRSLASGEVTGIRHAELVNWTGQALAVPRSRLDGLGSPHPYALVAQLVAHGWVDASVRPIAEAAQPTRRRIAPRHQEAAC